MTEIKKKRLTAKVKEEYADLVKKIRFYNEKYEAGESVVSDYEYDQLMLSLKEFEKTWPGLVGSSSPTQTVGAAVKRESGIKITHDVPMLSIEDVFTKDDVISWVNKVLSIHPECTFSVETKIDGLSATFRYKKGEDNKLHFVLCETRGDGIEGEDVTLNAKVIPDVQQIIDLPYDELQLRGEVYMSHEDFERYNHNQESKGEKIAANPRNLAAGTFKLLDPNITKERGLRVFIFNVQIGPDEVKTDHIKGLDVLSNKGVSVVYHEQCSTAEEVISVIDKIADMREKLGYDIDGAVVKINEIRYRDDFPAGSKYSSGHIAYKYPPEERVVVMDDIIVDVGRTGKLTYTGIFRDKETGRVAKLCGTSVSRATLHNQDYIKDMKIGIGGSYKLFKSGEIIPKLNGCVDEPEQIFEAPRHCPVCGAVLHKEEGIPDIYCDNHYCQAQLTRTVSYFTSLNCMNIIGLGDAIVDALVKEGYIKDYADIYGLKNHREELIQKKIIGKETNTDKILDAIEKSKTNDVTRLLTALAIRNVGKGAAKDIMKHFSGIQELMNATVEELSLIDDIGPTTAKCIVDFFDDNENKQVIARLEEAGVNMKTKKQESASNSLAGLTIVVTGTLPTFGRKEVQELIEKNGGKCTDNVSKKTSLLVAGEAAGSKLTKAQKLGIKIIDEAELLKMIG